VSADPVDRLRAICLAFPEAVEAGGVGNPSFKVRERIFAMQHGHENRPSAWLKAQDGVQELLVGSNPARFFRPRTSATTAGSAPGSTSSRTGTSSPTWSRRATA
jgi:hypothetical protein